MGRAIVAAVACAAALLGLVAEAADTMIDWVAAGGSYSGAFNAADHWSPQTWGYPGSQAPESSVAYQCARFNLIDADYTVTFPAGDFATTANVFIYGAANRTVRFTGTGTAWSVPATTVANYDFNPFIIAAGDTKASLVKNDVQWGSVTTESVIDFSNFDFTVSDLDGVRRVDFLSGSYQFNSRRLFFFDGTSSEGMVVNVANGCTFDAPQHTVALYSAGPHNELVLDGPVVTWYSFSFSGNDPTHETTLRLRNGAKATVSGGTGIGNQKARMILEGGSSIAGTNADVTPSAENEFEVVATGTGTTVGMRHWKLGDYAGAKGTMVLADGAKLSPNGAVTLGGSTAEKVVGSFGGLYVTNAVVSPGTLFTAYNGEFVFGPGTELMMNQGGGFRGGDVGGVSRIVFDGAVVHHAWGTQADQGVSGFTTAELGAGGLTFEYGNNYKDQSYAVTQNFVDAEGVEGKLVFKGKVTGTLAGDDSKESHLDIAVDSGYTVTMKDEAKHYSHVVVRNGGTLSLQGATQTGATFQSLTLGQGSTAGVLALDADEPVTADEGLSFVNGDIRFGTTLSYAKHTVFRVLAANSTAEMEDAWKYQNGFAVTVGLPPGAYVKYVCTPDGDHTLYQVDVRTSRPELEGDTGWSGGSGSWDDPEKWGAGGKPTQNLRAVFEGDGSAATVTVADAAEAAAIRFVTGDYTITGGALTLSDNEDAAIESQAGKNVIASGLLLDAQTECLVADGSTLEISGKINGMGLAKTGAGELKLSGDGSSMSTGLDIQKGSVSFTGEDPLTVKAELKVDSAATEAVLVRADVPVTMKLGDSASGALVKAGGAPLVLETGRNVTLGFAASSADSVPATDYDFSNGFDAAQPHGALNVAEGELVIRGTGEQVPKVTIPAPSDNKSHSFVGLRVKNPMEEPGLVIDHAALVLSSRELYLGAGLAAGQSFATEPYLILTNGAALTTRNFLSTGNGTAYPAHVRVKADSSTLNVNQLYPNVSGSASVTNDYVFRNGSSFFSSASINVQGSTRFSFDGSGFFGGNSNQVAGVQIGQGFGERSGFILSMTFANGSVFKAKPLSFTAPTASTEAPVVLTFDDAEWFAGDQDVDLATPNLNVKTVVEGRGVVFAPPTGRTWRMITPITGSGNLVKRGAGEFRFCPQMKYFKAVEADPVTLAYTGLTDVQEGLLTVESGAAATGARFNTAAAGIVDFGGGELVDAEIGGAGIFRNGELSGAVLKAGENAPLLDFENGLSLSGRVRVDFGRAADDPLPLGTAITVARWSGTKPDVSKWRTANAGTGVKCIFAANDDGTITAVPRISGLMIIIK